jgi:hypothetical protein
VKRYLLLFVLALACATFANAQSGFDIGVGFGASQAPAAKTGIDSNLNSCTIGSTDCQKTPSLNSFMMGFRGELIAWGRFGIGAEYNFEPAKKDFVTFPAQNNFSYALKSRVGFYDFNAIAVPVKSSHAMLKVEGGIGGANIKFYESGTSTTALVGTQNYTQYFGSSNHFQVHGGAGLQIYPGGGNWWIRPEVDVHYVRNLEQFGRNTVLRYSVWLGYTLGR